jgi:hypothetical protein
VAVHNYDVSYIKGECRSAPRIFGVPCGYERGDEYKDVSKPRTMSNGTFLHMGVRVVRLGTSSPSGFDRVHLVGSAQNPRPSGAVSLLS